MGMYDRRPCICFVWIEPCILWGFFCEDVCVCSPVLGFWSVRKLSPQHPVGPLGRQNLMNFIYYKLPNRKIHFLYILYYIYDNFYDISRYFMDVGYLRDRCRLRVKWLLRWLIWRDPSPVRLDGWS